MLSCFFIKYSFHIQKGSYLIQQLEQLDISNIYRNQSLAYLQIFIAFIISAVSRERRLVKR